MVLVFLIAGLVMLTLLMLLNPRVGAATIDARLDLVTTTVATLIAIAVALLAWGRHRESGELPGLFRGSAFLVLASYNALIVTVVLFNLDLAFGMSLDRPGQLPLLGNAAARGVAATLLVLGGRARLRGGPSPRLPSLLVLGLPSLLLVAALVLGAIVQTSLPVIMGPAEAAQLRANPQQPTFGGIGLLAMAVAQIVIGLAFGVAAWLSYLSYRRDPHVQEAYLAVGFVLAAFSQVHTAIHPGAYVSLVTTGDLLRVAFYAVLLLGVVAVRREDLRALRRAHLDLQRLREAELAEATGEERARLAREIHDGLAQDLWYAKLKQARLAAMEPMTPEARGLAEDVAAAIDASLADARQAVMALRPTESGPFAQVLARFVEDFGDRFGILVECTVEPDVEVGSARTQAELLRIVQEALNNVRKHADATLVRVGARRIDGDLWLSISDNGRGFDANLAPPGGYGLRSMAERAAMVGGALTIVTRPQDGTRVEVLLVAGGEPA